MITEKAEVNVICTSPVGEEENISALGPPE